MNCARWRPRPVQLLALGGCIALGFALVDGNWWGDQASAEPPRKAEAAAEATIAAALPASPAPAAATQPAPAAPVAPASSAAPQAPAQAVAEAHAAFEQALSYIDCAERAADAASGPPALSEAYALDPSGRLAQAEFASARSLGERCRAVGPNELRSAQDLLQSAAQRGDTDARSYLLARRAQAWMRHLADPSGTPAVDEAEAASVRAGLEALALAGHRSSMEQLAQMLEANAPAQADPTQAAAWRVVAHLADSGWPGDAQVLGMMPGIVDVPDGEPAQAVLRASAALYARCCGAAN